jgi:hypothetical protein
MKPMPQPKQTPWLRKSCQVLVAKDAPMSERAWKKTPIRSVTRVLKMRVVAVAIGETMRAWEMERPPWWVSWERWIEEYWWEVHTDECEFESRGSWKDICAQI